MGGCADDADASYEDGFGRRAHFGQSLARLGTDGRQRQKLVDEGVDADAEFRCCPAAGADRPAAQ